MEAERITARAELLAVHLRAGNQDAALRQAMDLRALLDGICRELTIATVAECNRLLQTERQPVLRAECKSLLQTSDGCQTVLQPEVRETVSQTNSDTVSEYRPSLSQYLTLETWQHSAGAPAIRAAAERDLSKGVANG
jgi:hypothetical protein